MYSVFSRGIVIVPRPRWDVARPVSRQLIGLQRPCPPSDLQDVDLVVDPSPFRSQIPLFLPCLAVVRHDQLRTHLADFLAAYNFARRLKTLNGLRPHEDICKIWTSDPDRFILDPIHQMPGLNT